jgi:hypothetical protein
MIVDPINMEKAASGRCYASSARQFRELMVELANLYSLKEYVLIWINPSDDLIRTHIEGNHITRV